MEMRDTPSPVGWLNGERDGEHCLKSNLYSKSVKKNNLSMYLCHSSLERGVWEKRVEEH